jgi:hypothetical protein
MLSFYSLSGDGQALGAQGRQFKAQRIPDDIQLQPNGDIFLIKAINVTGHLRFDPIGLQGFSLPYGDTTHCGGPMQLKCSRHLDASKPVSAFKPSLPERRGRIQEGEKLGRCGFSPTGGKPSHGLRAILKLIDRKPRWIKASPRLGRELGLS